MDDIEIPGQLYLFVRSLVDFRNVHLSSLSLSLYGLSSLHFFHYLHWCSILELVLRISLTRVWTGSPPNYSFLASNFPIGDEARQVAVSLCRLNCFEEASLLFIHPGTTLLEINENDSRTVSVPDSTRTLDNFSWPAARAIPPCLKTSYSCRAFRYAHSVIFSFFFFSCVRYRLTFDRSKYFFINILLIVTLLATYMYIYAYERYADSFAMLHKRETGSVIASYIYHFSRGTRRLYLVFFF